LCDGVALNLKQKKCQEGAPNYPLGSDINCRADVNAAMAELVCVHVFDMLAAGPTVLGSRSGHGRAILRRASPADIGDGDDNGIHRATNGTSVGSLNATLSLPSLAPG